MTLRVEPDQGQPVHANPTGAVGWTAWAVRLAGSSRPIICLAL